MRLYFVSHNAVILSWIIYKYSNLVTNTRSVSEESSLDKNLEKLNKVNWTAAPLLPFPTFSTRDSAEQRVMLVAVVSHLICTYWS